jgi:hypothetical protein
MPMIRGGSQESLCLWRGDSSGPQEGKRHVRTRYQRTDEGTAHREDQMCAIANCRKTEN